MINLQLPKPVKKGASLQAVAWHEPHRQKQNCLPFSTILLSPPCPVVFHVMTPVNQLSCGQAVLAFKGIASDALR
jgi:hypothetical protein